MEEEITSEVFPLLWSDDVGRIADWAKTTLGLTESWRAAGESGQVEHAELLWPGGKVSVNIRQDVYADMGPSGIALRVNDRNQVDATYAMAIAARTEIARELEDSRIAYSFTALDPDGNQWWVHAETGFLDELRQSNDG